MRNKTPGISVKKCREFLVEEKGNMLSEYDQQ